MYKSINLTIVIINVGQNPCKSLYVVHLTGLPMCIDTEDITMPPAVTDVNYSIVTGDAKTVRAKSLDGLSAAEIHPSIPLLTVISLSLQYCEIFLFRWM